MLGHKLRNELSSKRHPSKQQPSSSSSAAPPSPPTNHDALSSSSRNQRGGNQSSTPMRTRSPNSTTSFSAMAHLDASSLRRAVEVVGMVDVATTPTAGVPSRNSRGASPCRKACAGVHISQLYTGVSGMSGLTERPSSRTRSPSARHTAVADHLQGSGANLRPDVYQQFQGCRRHVVEPRSTRGSIGCGGAIVEKRGGSISRDVSVERPSSRIRRSSVETPYRGLGCFGPDPSEAKKERPIPPPMIKKPWKRGVKMVPEPASTRYNDCDNRYSRVTETGSYQHGKRQVNTKHFEPKPASIRFGLSPQNHMHSFRVASPPRLIRVESIRCGSPTARPRPFNIISNVGFA